MRLRRKLLWVLIATSAAASLALGVGAARVLAGVVRAEVGLRLENEAGLLGGLVAAAPDAAAADRLVREAGRRLGVRVTWIAGDGRVLADSSKPPEEVPAMENHLGRPEVAEARRAGTGASVRRSDTTGVEYHYLARRIESAGAEGFVRVALPIADMERFEREHLVLLGGSIAAALALLSVLSYLLVRRISRPIEDMSTAAGRVAAGDLACAVPEPSEEELGRLGASMNRMKDVLVAKLGEIETEQRFLKTMTDGMEEGLLLVGPGHRVLLDNAAFRRIFRIGFAPTGYRLGEVARHPTVVSVIDEVFRTGRDARETVRGTPGSDRSFEMHARPVVIPGPEKERGVLVLFFDITRLEALENVRRLFVADVSHELRTPVTSIKGSIETLLEGGYVADADAVRFLEMAARQTDRMAALIADLTDLSLIETGAIRLEIESVDLASLAAGVVESISQRHPASEVGVVSDVPRGFAVRADRRRLEQVLVNLVDNGVKFNRPGGRVVVSATRRGGAVRITVEDTGAGIPFESQDKVFQRFYRVDKSRSQAVGGTGLGLAIVKHLVHLHEGEVSLESAPGQGSRFHVDLPAA